MAWCGVTSDLQHQPTPWSCLPAAFAISMGIPVETVLERLGHNDERGFHQMELNYLALELGHWYTPFEAEPELTPQPCAKCDGVGAISLGEGRLGEMFDECNACKGTGHEDNKSFLRKPDIARLMKEHEGVIVGTVNGKPHAACWKGGWVWDPNYTVSKLEAWKVEMFWAKLK